MNCFEEDVPVPLSPMADYFSSSLINVFVIAVAESEIPIDDSKVQPLLKNKLLPICSRFSSIMVADKNGKKVWKQVDVNLQDHVKIPKFTSTNGTLKSYDECFDEYMSKIAMEQFPEDKPLWELHLFKYPTSKCEGTFIFKLHHALGDGYSFMTTFLSIVESADNPSVQIKFPSSKSSTSTNAMPKQLSQTASMFKSAFDFGWSLLKNSLIPDEQTPLRSGHEDVGFRPMSIVNVSLSLDNIKEVKNKLKVSVNDVLVGAIFFGIQLYMKAKNHRSRTAETTALVLLNTRNIRAYISAKEMHATNSKAPWGNRFHFMHVPVPMISDKKELNPLEFVLDAKKSINRQRNSLAVPMTGVLLRLLNQIKGPQAATNYMYKIMNNASLSISHMVGPAEKVTLAYHPIKGFYFMTVGLSQSMTVTITSYMGYLRVGFGVEEGFIDEYQLKSCFEISLQMILEAAKNLPKK
ncbi:wax ester synthase/diacylglycerol acyltransferase 5-like [Vigna umbellata]|uniref:wax ester synthase/diacylglycerol acyltransferase 5-like n=1 Tax=Vigna umbellata TaxID=87088 RepID=UPI001F5FCEAF|nr:wax ester synthase/diacylglycerol acyltransferase 5-like [Vigna umbellata]